MVIEETFELSDRLIDEIGFTQLGEQYEITVFPNRLLFGALGAVEYAIAGYYNLKYGLLNKPEEYQDVDEQLGDTQMIFHEALVNAIWHGANNEHPVKTAIFLGEKGVCFGFYDGGDYFKREDIKEICVDQVFWVANLSLDILGTYVLTIYDYIIGMDQGAFIPMDNKLKILTEDNKVRLKK